MYPVTVTGLERKFLYIKIGYIVVSTILVISMWNYTHDAVLQNTIFGIFLLSFGIFTGATNRIISNEYAEISQALAYEISYIHRFLAFVSYMAAIAVLVIPELTR